jgi:Family of unknown function (DUF5994)
MTLKTDHTDADRHHAGPEHTPRLRLKPKAPHSGYVDGAWWPHSDDLSAEIPDLLTVLKVRLGPIERVTYRIDEWSTAPRKFFTGERMVRLDGYRTQPAHTLEVLGLNRQTLVLLVVAPGADADQAHAVMMTAAGPDNALTVADLLATSSDESVDA